MFATQCGGRRWCALWAGLSAIAGTCAPAVAQGPSFTALIIGREANVSASGRFVVASSDFSLTRLDLQTGAAVGINGLNTGFVDLHVTDSGVVFGVQTGLCDDVFRWDPGTGTIVYMPGENLLCNKSLEAISRDGLFGVGYTEDWIIGGPGNRVLYDFSVTPPAVQVLALGPGGDPEGFQRNFAGITDPVNGVRFLRGTVEFDNIVMGATWPLGEPLPLREPAWTEIVDVSPRNDIAVGIANGAVVVRGDGFERTLLAPIFPFIMSNPFPAAMSDDGRVVGGVARLNSSPDAVIWREGLQATTLRAILEGVGVSVPPMLSSGITGISADGSVVTGRFYNPTEQGFLAVLPATNDTCETARPIGYGTVIGATRGATRAGFSGNCHTEGNAPDIWFSFVPAASETISIDTCGSAFDTTLTLFQAANCGALGTPLACNDDASPECAENVFNSRVNASVIAGLTYYIRVSGWNGSFGSVRLTVAAPGRPLNDTCAAAVDITVDSGVDYAFSNLNAITDPRPGCGAQVPSGDIWFRCVAPETGRLTFSTCGSSINTVVMVYGGDACTNPGAAAIACGSGSTACIATGGGNGTRVTVPCTFGETFYVRVGGLFGSSGPGFFRASYACGVNNSSSYNAAVLSSGPLDYWRFDDPGHRTAADAVRFDAFSCGDNRGEYLLGAQRTGDFQGDALTLDRRGGHVRIWGAPSVSHPDVCAQPSYVALEAWVKTTNPFAGVVITNRNLPMQHSLTVSIGANPLSLQFSEGRVYFASDGPDTFFGARSTVRVDDGRWHHLVCMRFPTVGGRYTYSIYIDGQAASSPLTGAGTAHFGTPGSYWTVGTHDVWPVDDAAFDGKIDEVAIYCTSVPISHWVNHYNIGRPCPADFNSDGQVNSQDFFDFLNAFFSNLPSGDFNRSGAVNSQDFFDYVAAFFSGCG